MILLGVIVLLLGGYLVYAPGASGSVLRSRTLYRRFFVWYSWS